jgi:hypothetical protein
MTDTPTPRTDAALACECPRPSYLFTEFAREMERELAEAKNKSTDWEEMAHELATALEYALESEVSGPKSILKLYYKMKGTK